VAAAVWYVFRERVRCDRVSVVIRNGLVASDRGWLFKILITTVEVNAL
jgi:hypothetical protein